MAKRKVENYTFRPGISFLGNLYPDEWQSFVDNVPFIKAELTAYLNYRIGIDTEVNLYPDAVRLLTNNVNFIKEEATAWIATQVAGAFPGFVGYTYDVAKCKRDIGYVLTAYIHDLRYGGNEDTRSVIAKYWINDEPQVDGDRQAEVKTHEFIRDLITDVIFPRATYTPLQVVATRYTTAPSAEATAGARIDALSVITTTVIANGLASMPAISYKSAAFENYTFNSEKCQRDLGYVLDGYLHDLRYGGNEETRYVIQKYYDNGVLQVDGSGQAEVEGHRFVRNLIINNVMQNEAGITLYPEAVRLLTLNKAYLQNEIVGWIANEVTEATKCERDIGYLIDGAKFDIALGTNYNALFLGLAEYNSLDNDFFVIDTIERTKLAIAALPNVAASTAAVARNNSFFNEVLDIIDNGRESANELVLAEPSNATVSRIAAKNQLIANKNFLAAEVNAFVALQYPTADHDPVKCTRDVKYAIDALAYDMLYGGNSATYDQARFFFYGFANNDPGIDPTHRLQTVAAYVHLKQVIGQVVQNQFVTKTTGNTLSQNQTFPPATGADAIIVQDLVQLTADVVAATNVTQANAILAGITRTVPSVTFATAPLQTAFNAITTSKTAVISQVVVFKNYTYDAAKCVRDSGYVIDALIYDLENNGNEESRRIAQKYYIDGVFQVDGSRIPEIASYRFLQETIKNYIFPRLNAPDYQIVYPQILTAPSAETGAYTRITELTDIFINFLEDGPTSLPTLSPRTVPYQVVEEQVVDSSKAYDPDAGVTITNLSNSLINLIEQGLSSLPPKEAAGYGLIKFQGVVRLEDLLLITNTSKNVVIYNFSSNTAGGSLIPEFDGDDEAFTAFKQVTDRVVHLRLNYDTSTMDETDELQIFVEGQEMRVRPYEFGTDAIERHRVAAPQSMLDADFEYGLQPTKWQAIGIARGYPSVYEVPGSDFEVTAITSDASFPNNGVGASTITVTTAAPHQLSAGTPVTVAGLDTSISGISRAEGAFVIVTVPTPTTFTYFAKSRVGTTSGTSLRTTYTQIRKGGFYTGASIGQPTINLLSNGTAGSFVTQFDTPAATSKFAVASGTIPSVGSPFNAAVGIGFGSQVTAVVGSGGIVTTPTVLGDYSPTLLGLTTLTVSSTTGIVIGLGANDQTGSATFVESIAGTDVTFTRPFSGAIIGNTTTYTELEGTNEISIGSAATFDVTGSSAGYLSVAVNTGGSDYQVGDVLRILGTDLSGTSPANDLLIKVATVSSGTILTADVISGTSVMSSGNETISGINSGSYTATSPDSTLGSGATFDVTRTGTGFSSVINAAGTGYVKGTEFLILGTVFTSNATPANDVTITVTQTTAAFTGLLQDATSISGSSAQFDVTRIGAAYTSLVVSFAGSGYTTGEIVTIYGTQLGGNTPSNDLLIQIDNVGGSGEIIAASLVAGLIANEDGTGVISQITTAGVGDDRTTLTNTPVVIVPGSGINGEFTITRTASGYTNLVVSNGGTAYLPGNRIRILGSDLGGANTTNDAIVSVTSVDSGTGAITAATVTGTGVAGINLALYSSVTVSEFTTATITSGTSLAFGTLATLQIIFQEPHGIPPGGSFIVTVSSDNGGNNHSLANGSFSATQIPTRNSITFQARSPGVITGAPITGVVYPRPDSFFTHRPFDGGVQLGTGGPQHGVQAIRQSKKYIRYQSGKGVMYTTGALFAPSYDVLSIIATDIEVGATIEITLGDNDHGLQRGAVIRLAGVLTGGYDGDYDVDEIVSERTFRIIATKRVGSRKPNLSFNCQISTLRWKGAVVRAGVFDDQNGIYWEYDGQTLSAVQRTSTKQLAGTISVNAGSNRVTGLNSRFRDQIKAGDSVTIRGMTHVVTHVDSQTSMTVNPDYRGVNNVSNAKMSLISEVRVQQKDFNKDRLDGTGPSGYDLDITKMQMIGIQYSWYGAGFIDFMLRGSDGNYVFAHRMRNSNINTEAYMRTGNLPVRYEVSNYGSVSRLVGNITNTSTSLTLESTDGFPDTGIVYIDNEMISYTTVDRTTNVLSGCARSAQLDLFIAGANRNFTAGAAANHSTGTGVILLNNTTTPLISHWGSAFLTDGLFDFDRGYIFNYASTGLSVSTTKATAFLIRLAPSVSNAVVGDLGERELLNRAQLLLKEIAVTSDTGTGGLIVEGVLNPQNYPANPSDIIWSGLSGVAAGGQPSFAQIAPGGSVNWSGGVAQPTANATALNTVNSNVTVPNRPAFNRGSGSSFVYVTQASWNSSGASSGFAIAASDTKFQAGTTVSSLATSPTPAATTLGTLTSSIQTFYRSVTIQGSNNNGVTVTLFFNNQGYTPFPVNSRINVQPNPSTLQGTYIVTGAGNNFVQFNAPGLGNANSGSISTAYQAGQTVLNITEASWNNMTSVVTQTGFLVTTVFPTNTTITAVTSIQGTSPNRYYSVTFSNGLPSDLPLSAQTINTSFGGSRTTTNNLFFTAASWTALPVDVPVIGTATNDTAKFTAGTQINGISGLQTFGGTGYYSVTFTNACIGTVSGGSTVTFDTIPYYTLFLSRTTAAAVNQNNTITMTLAQNTSLTNFVYLTQASWESLVTNYSAGAGTEVSDTKFAAGTRVATVSSLRTFGGTGYYTLTFTQTSNAAVAGGATITFKFGQPPYALPGEQVFSFISLPGSSDQLDLSELKELTNTTLGGRGTFPNGPDVLAINIYKVSGAAVNANVILRWSEAQA